jgi:predicted hotdog family 3-hydroxylacyl-ACP dehydratase
MKIDRSWIAAHIPHQGSMCLLDHIESWNAERLIAVATSHSAPDNPLRAHGRLGAANGIEYAAQAMAVHSALLATSQPNATDMARPQAGFLASVRNAALHVSRLDDLAEALQIEVVCIHSEPNCILYQFEIRASDTRRPLLDGRATIIIDASMVVTNRGASAS